MTYREPDHETAIVQKLKDMEDLLKSFMASLEEPLQKKGMVRKVEAPGAGEIFWSEDVWDRKMVEAGEFLCIIKYAEGPWQFHRVYSPADGQLNILKKRGSVSAGEDIAEIDEDVLV